MNVLTKLVKLIDRWLWLFAPLLLLIVGGFVMHYRATKHANAPDLLPGTPANVPVAPMVTPAPLPVVTPTIVVPDKPAVVVPERPARFVPNLATPAISRLPKQSMPLATPHAAAELAKPPKLASPYDMETQAGRKSCYEAAQRGDPQALHILWAEVDRRKALKDAADKADYDRKVREADEFSKQWHAKHDKEIRERQHDKEKAHDTKSKAQPAK